jgi:RNA polymerase sigma factor (sigma-70 family)
MLPSGTQELLPILNRLLQGDESARADILNCCSKQLTRLTSKMLKDFPAVRRWEDTDDVFQNASIRLHRSLATVTFPSADDFFRFASTLIRRELVDLSRHYQGPEGHGTHQARQASRTDSYTSDRLNPDTDTHDPQQLFAWTEFHATVERLSDDDRQMFDLLWYQELSQVDAAVLLNVSERTIQRRWQHARIRLQELLELTRSVDAQEP